MMRRRLHERIDELHDLVAHVAQAAREGLEALDRGTVEIEARVSKLEKDTTIARFDPPADESRAETIGEQMLRFRDQTRPEVEGDAQQGRLREYVKYTRRITELEQANAELLAANVALVKSARPLSDIEHLLERDGAGTVTISYSFEDHRWSALIATRRDPLHHAPRSALGATLAEALVKALTEEAPSEAWREIATCPECGLPLPGPHRGTCSVSRMRGGPGFGLPEAS